jgi:large subunit ribosomal protein L15
MDIGKAKAIVHRPDRKKRIGRGTGSRRGKTSGRGRDGAKSRSGWSSRGMTGGAIPLWRRLPKRGVSKAPFRKEYSVINVAALNRFPAGTTVTPEELESAGLLKQPSRFGVKVLGDGELEKALTVRANAFSKSAVAKIEAAGGTVDVIPPPKPSVRNKMRSTTPTVDLTPEA